MAVPPVPAANTQQPQQVVPTVAPQRPGQNPLVAEEPPQPQQEKHTIPPEIPYAAYHMAAKYCTCKPPFDVLCEYCKSLEDEPREKEKNANVKWARGGWHRISMSTVQSDDKRFTITHVDKTIRNDWFLLKDLETGETYEETTMTGAKKKAKGIRGDVEDDLELDEMGEDDPSYQDPPFYQRTTEDLNTETPNRTSGGFTMARTIQANRYETCSSCAGKGCNECNGKGKTIKTYEELPWEKKKGSSKWARLRQVAAEEPKEADAAIAEVADALGTMADALGNLRENLDLLEAPKTANIKVRIATARKYATAFRRMAEEAPEVIANAISEVYHSLDDVAGALENLAENMGIELNLSPVEEEFDAEAGHEPEEPTVDESEFEEGEKELESPEAEPAEEELDEEIDKEAGAQEWTSDRDEEGQPKAPVTAAKKKELPDFLKKKKDEKDDKKGDKDKKKEKKADGGAGFVTYRGNDAKPEPPAKAEIPQAQGETEVGKAAAEAKRAAVRQRIAKRWGVTV